MNWDNKSLYWIGSHRNKIFWALFIILGSFMISGIMINVFYVDILLGLFLVIIGLYKLGDEFITDKLGHEQKRIMDDMDSVLEWLNHSYDFTKSLQSRHENRIHKLDNKRADMDKRIESNYRDLVRKIIEVENKLNKTSREVQREKNLVDKVDKLASLLVKERRMIEKKVFDVSERQIKALKLVRKNGRITTRDYVKNFRVRNKTALTEIKELVKKEFIRRKGKGSAIHYVQNF